MSDTSRFLVFMATAAGVFVAVLLFVVRARDRKPNNAVLILMTLIVVALGMLFARYGYIFFRPPWWIYYGVPALVTFFLPPAALRMKRKEVLQYVPLAILMGPVIHVFFSLFVGWHDYMPNFPFYVPSILELVRRIR